MPITTLPAAATLRAFRAEPLELFGRIAGEPAGMARMRLLHKEVFFVSTAHHVHHVLQTAHRNYDKNVPIFNNARPVFGDGLPIAHGGEAWLRQRRLMQPAFHHDRVTAVTDHTETYLPDVVARWAAAARSGEPVDVANEMTRLTMRVIGRTLFGVDVDSSASGIAANFERAAMLTSDYLTRPFPPLFVPTKRNRTFRATLRAIDELVADVVRARKADPAPHNDLLALLMDGDRMSPKQLRDEIVSLFFAGHDTIANTLSWCWYLLAHHPEVDEQLREELARVLGGRTPTVDDLARLPYTRQVLDETMRLYPALWCLMRRAVRDDEIGGHRIPAEAYVIWSAHTVNRDPSFWPAPNRFDPGRFAPQACAERPRYAAVPFGEGPRACLGAHFATAEGMLILATLAQRFRVQAVPGREPVPTPAITLRPIGGVWATVQERT